MLVGRTVTDRRRGPRHLLVRLPPQVPALDAVAGGGHAGRQGSSGADRAQAGRRSTHRPATRWPSPRPRRRISTGSSVRSGASPATPSCDRVTSSASARGRSSPSTVATRRRGADMRQAEHVLLVDDGGPTAAAASRQPCSPTSIRWPPPRRAGAPRGLEPTRAHRDVAAAHDRARPPRPADAMTATSPASPASYGTGGGPGVGRRGARGWRTSGSSRPSPSCRSHRSRRGLEHRRDRRRTGRHGLDVGRDARLQRA